MVHYSTTEVRKHLNEIINRVKYQKIVISVGRHNKQEVLIVPKPETEDELPISEINAASSSFVFLKNEPDLYSLKDLKRRYV